MCRLRGRSRATGWQHDEHPRRRTEPGSKWLFRSLVVFSEYHVHVYTWVLIGDKDSNIVLLGGLGTNTGGTGTTPPPRMQPPRSMQWASSLSGQLRHSPLGNSLKLMLHNYPTQRARELGYLCSNSWEPLIERNHWWLLPGAFSSQHFPTAAVLGRKVLRPRDRNFRLTLGALALWGLTDVTSILTRWL